MSLQIRFGIAGVVLGLVIGVIGCLAAQVPIGILLLRTLVAMIFTGVLGLVLYGAIKLLLPELFTNVPAHQGDELAEASGRMVNITVSDANDGLDYQASGDQAEALRQLATKSSYGADEFGEGSSGDPDASGMIEEVSEDRRVRALSADASEEGAFNEAAFFQGVERLPDIGGFSEQFQVGEGTVESEADDAAESFGGGGPSTAGSGSRKGQGQSNMDPALIAQAIRTALKKDDR